MKRQIHQYEKETLQKIVSESISFREVCRKLNRKPVGGTVSYLRQLCIRWAIDCGHMLGRGHRKGKPAFHRKTVAEVLVMRDPSSGRTDVAQLRRSMFEVGFEHKCTSCGLGDMWNGEPITLEIDHIDEQYWNNMRENLQFLCPNCHSQKTKRQSQRKSSKVDEDMNYRSREQYVADRRAQYEAVQKPLVELVLNSGIDFGKLGWVKQVSELIGQKEQKVNLWMKRMMPEFYEERCYKRKSKL
jgi:hypothetical protein